MWTFEIPGRLPGLNEIVAANRSNRYAGAELKRRETARCGEWVIAGGIPKIKHPVTVEVLWTEPNERRDIDNVSAGVKFILDALVSCGRLKNDTREWVRGISHRFPRPDKENPNVRVILTEAA